MLTERNARIPLNLLVDHRLLAESDVTAIRSWHQRDALPGEEMLDFLIRQEVFSSEAPLLVELLHQGIALQGAVQRIFHRLGVDKLSREVAAQQAYLVTPTQSPSVHRTKSSHRTTAMISALPEKFQQYVKLAGETPASQNGVEPGEVTETVRVDAPPMVPPPSVVPSTATEMRSTTDTVSDLEIGTVLGRCKLLERIGRGTCGSVYRAQHLTLDVPVAVKLLHRAKTDQDMEMYRLLRREARLLAQLNHPHIVRIWDFDDHPSMPYLVMELVEGPNLQQLIEQAGSVPQTRAVQVLYEVIDALASAQNLGIIHRDLKPANILLASDGTAKLADLGLGLRTTTHAPDQSMAFDANRMVGTIAYMSPEQARSNNLVNHQSDIYSLGATFYHALTGKMVFTGSSMEVLMAHAMKNPTPLTQLVPNVDGGLAAIIHRMLAKKQEDRYGTYEELLADLLPVYHRLCRSPESETQRTTRIVALRKTLMTTRPTASAAPTEVPTETPTVANSDFAKSSGRLAELLKRYQKRQE